MNENIVIDGLKINQTKETIQIGDTIYSIPKYAQSDVSSFEVLGDGIYVVNGYELNTETKVFAKRKSFLNKRRGTVSFIISILLLISMIFSITTGLKYVSGTLAILLVISVLVYDVSIPYPYMKRKS